MNAGRGIGAIRRDVNPQVALDVRKVCQFFIQLALCTEDNAVRKLMAAKFGENAADQMLDFYRQNAEYLAELFNYQ